MFRLEHAEKFNKFFTEAQQPVQRVKLRCAEPRYAWELTKINTANASGIPLQFNGRTTATPRYKVTLYCDVCALTLVTMDASGKPREVDVGEVTEMQSAFQNEKPLLDKQHYALYAGQCLNCGRWGGKGSNHTYCFDSKTKTCTSCIQ